MRGCREAQAWFPWHRQLAAPRATTPAVAPRATTPLGSGWLGRASTAHRAARARSLAHWRPRGSEPWHEHQDGALAGGGRVASGEHVLGLLGRPQVELERDRLGYVRADVPGAVAQAASTTCTLLGPAIQLLLQFLYSYSYSYYSHFYLLRLLLLPLLSPVPAAALRAEDDGEVGRGPAQPLRGIAVGAAVVAGQREHLGYGLGRG